MNVLKTNAWAKVNLTLHVVGRRDDGYHLLDSLIAFAAIGDTIEAVVSDRPFTLEVDGPTASLLPEGELNIVEKASRALADHAGVVIGTHIRLTKRLPVAAGIGGGSADAAATLHLLNRLWRLGLDADELARIGLSLGADVPVCLAGRATNLGGIGEVLDPAPALPEAWITLVNPMIACPTPAVFKARKGPFSPPAPLTTSPKDAADLARVLAERGNDLTEAAISVVPAIGEVLARIAAQPGCLLSRMSGSGATCFGLFASESEAVALEKALGVECSEWWSAAARLVG